MNLHYITNDLKNRIYLTRFRLKHKDTDLIFKFKLSFILLFIVLLVPTSYIALLNFFPKISKNTPEEIIEKNAYIKVSTNSKFKAPIAGVITSPYGYRVDPISGKSSKHTGVDISGIHYDNVKCMTDGIITFAGVQNGYGNCIEVKHNINGNEIYSFYAHLSKILVSQNEQVTEEQIIAIEGGDPRTDPNAGYSTGHHLHFEIRTSSGYGNDIDPEKYIYY